MRKPQALLPVTLVHPQFSYAGNPEFELEKRDVDAS